MATAKKILILYASYGTGHLQVSQALQRSFQDAGIRDVLLVDLFAEAHPLINAFTKFLYLKSFSVLSSLYGWSYYSTQAMNHERTITQWFNSFGLHKLQEIIEREQPDVVINTFPMLVMPEFRRKTGIYIPTCNVLTDFDLHQRWMHPEIDRYYVATDELKQQMARRGVPAERIVVSGIPLRAEFEQQEFSLDRHEELHDKYGLTFGKQTALVLAGALGVTKNLEAVCETFAAAPGWQVVLVCGRNRQANERLRNYFAAVKNVHVFGYVEQIYELMQIASCMVTKPGGITLSEAIAVNVPLLIYRPVPGQERENAHYFQAQGAALLLEDAHDVTEIKQILTNERQLAQMRDALRGLYRPHAAETIVRDVLQAVAEVKEVYAYST